MSKERITHSRMQSFKLCRKKHYWEYEVGMRKELDSKALRMGSAGHEGLDVFKKTGDPTLAVEAVAKWYFLQPDSISSWDWSIESETVQTLVAGYCWHWEQSPLSVISSEQPFRFPLRNPASDRPSRLFERAGKIDGIVLQDNRCLVLEHKFIGEDISPGSSYWDRLRLDQQCTNYLDAARNLGHDAVGILYDLIRKPTIKPTIVPILDEGGLKIILDQDGNRVRRGSAAKKCKFCAGVDLNDHCRCSPGPWRQSADKQKGFFLKGRQMTPTEWSNRLMKDIGERPDWYYQRQEVTRLDGDVDMFLHEVWDVQQAIRTAQKTGSWYRTVNLGSCTYCPFFSLCVDNNPTNTGTPPHKYPEGFVKLNDVHPELQ